MGEHAPATSGDEVPRLIILGSGDALTSPSHDNTALAIATRHRLLLIDCSGSPVLKLRRSGFDAGDLDHVLLTHGHADHIYGLPALLQYLDLVGRDRPLPIYGNEEALSRARAITSALDVGTGFASWRSLDMGRGSEPFLEDDDYTLRAFPSCHSLPTTGYSMTLEPGAVSLVYSADTEPCLAVAEAARGADTLVHEATVLEPERGHSTPAQAAEVAAAAGAGLLVLVHLPEVLIRNPGPALAEAAAFFPGEIRLAADGDIIPLVRRH
jgi:ribonuclease Z